MTDRTHLGKDIGNIDFQTNRLPPVFIPIPIHSHIMPHPIIIQCLEQTQSHRLGHTVFFNLPDALKMLSKQDHEDIKSYLSSDYSIPFITVPHDLR
eukprot:UN00795